jgi:hypothetical protein
VRNHQYQQRRYRRALDAAVGLVAWRYGQSESEPYLRSADPDQLYVSIPYIHSTVSPSAPLIRICTRLAAITCAQPNRGTTHPRPIGYGWAAEMVAMYADAAPGGGKTATATVTDRCEGCALRDVDMTPTLFQKFSPLTLGRMGVNSEPLTWNWV